MELTNLLVTGGAGFIGSNFIPYFLKNHSNYQVINLDILSYAADLDNLKEIKNNDRYHFIKGDVCNRSLIQELFNDFDIHGVIHFAAESHVDNSIAMPGAFIKTNIEGTFTVLDEARKYWLHDGETISGFENSRFHHISTDEVYGSLGHTGFFNENTPYSPNSPYSASKASADMIVRSYYHTYGMNIVITNCSNNYGPKQHEEKLIPKIIKQALAGEAIPIYGDGKNVRDWLYVLDHCRAIDYVYHLGKKGESYNVGGNCEYENLAIANAVCSILDQLAGGRLKQLNLDSFRDLITFVPDRLGHDRRYAVDSSKITRELGWRSETEFNEGLYQTIQWYLDKSDSTRQRS